MQRQEASGVVISCDFCGVDWDPYDQQMTRPMVEGHHGSVICLGCLQSALKQMAEGEGPFRCTMCLREDLDPATEQWSHPNPTPAAGLNVDAVACRACLRQAAGRFHKDPDVDWQWSERSG